MNNQNANLELVKALGLEGRRVVSVRLHFQAKEMPTAFVEMLPTDKELLAVGEIIRKHYRLEEKT